MSAPRIYDTRWLVEASETDLLLAFFEETEALLQNKNVDGIALIHHAISQMIGRRTVDPKRGGDS